MIRSRLILMMDLASAPLMHPIAGAPQTLGEALAAVAERLADDGVADPPPWPGLIAARALGISRDRLDAEADRLPTAEERVRLRELVDRVAAGEPAAYLLGAAPFLGREFEVTRETLIPRRDTEELVRIVLARLGEEPLPERPRVLELGTGSGCVAITLALHLPEAEVVATDISAGALAVAARNAHRHGVVHRMTLAEGDIFDPVARVAADRPFHLIVSNPPYIPTGRIGAMGRAVAANEPHLALDGGDDGLRFHRCILVEAPRYLAPGGRIFLEHEADQGAIARRIGEASQVFEDVRILCDGRGRDRVLAARRR
jgi:release factor glutamine methyltransferase